MSEVAAGSGGRVWSPGSDTTTAPANKGEATKITLGLVAFFTAFVSVGLGLTLGAGISYGCLFFFFGGIALIVLVCSQLKKSLTFANHFTRILLIVLSLAIGIMAFIGVIDTPERIPSSAFLVEQTTELTGASGWRVLKTDKDSAVLRTDDKAVIVDFERMPSQEGWNVTLADPTEAVTYHK